jgi:hypothetical protein
MTFRAEPEYPTLDWDNFCSADSAKGKSSGNLNTVGKSPVIAAAAKTSSSGE